MNEEMEVFKRGEVSRQRVENGQIERENRLLKSEIKKIKEKMNKE
jgi:hypothetical protein